jgi:hypothetical protein
VNYCRIILVLVVASRLIDLTAIASAQTLRIVTYNVDADTGGGVGQMGGPDSGPGLTTVLQAIGNESLNGHAQPIDVLALQELNGTPTTTLNYIVGQLNNIYGAGTYAYDTTTDPTDGNNLNGNGPSGLIYNTRTVQDLGAVAIGTPSSSGPPRDPMRYQLQPVGVPAASFYMYVSHMKALTTSSDMTRRNDEATEIRTDAATLGASAHIIYSGDLNLTGSSEAAYKTLVGAGTGQANDPANPAQNWTASANFVGLLTESATQLQYRDDFQLVSGPTLNQNGLQLVSGTYTAFGNGGESSLWQSTVNSLNNTALSDLPNQSAVLSALTTATDHLPVVADYAAVGVAPPIPGDVNHDGVVNGLDISVVSSNWLQMGTGVSGDANNDGVVNGLDIAVISSNWLSTSGAGSSARSVPELGTLPLATLGAVFAIGRLLAARKVGRRAGQCEPERRSTIESAILLGEDTSAWSGILRGTTDFNGGANGSDN